MVRLRDDSILNAKKERGLSPRSLSSYTPDLTIQTTL